MDICLVMFLLFVIMVCCMFRCSLVDLLFCGVLCKKVIVGYCVLLIRFIWILVLNFWVFVKFELKVMNGGVCDVNFLIMVD